MNARRARARLRAAVLAPLCLILCLCCLAASGCGTLQEWLNGWGEEIDSLIEQIEEEAGSNGGTQSGGTQSGGQFNFTSRDLDGNTVKLADLTGVKVVMLNYWEPWCSPCVGELPALEKLYETYKDQGLLIVGVFSSTDMDEEARELIAANKITYPVVRYSGELTAFSPKYVPSTLFTDAGGNLLSSDPVVGANDYAAWEQLITNYLNNAD